MPKAGDPAGGVGDLSGDGWVGQADMDLVLDNWGDGCLPPPGDGGEVGVPEPSTLLLVGLGAGRAMRRRRKRGW